MSSISQKQTTILLVVVVVLLAAIVGILVAQGNDSSPAVVSTQPTAPTAPAGMPAPAGTSSGIAATGAEFDPATAPRVPEGQTPEEFVNAYYEACAAGDYDTAYLMLPTDKQAYYGDSTSFAGTLQGYAITGYSLDPPVDNGDEVSITGYQDAQGMSFGYTWVLVKGDDGAWLVKSRNMAGM